MARSRLIFAFEAVIIGGLGSLWGTLVGGIILGVAQTIGDQINPAYQILAGHLVFLVVLVFRPERPLPAYRAQARLIAHRAASRALPVERGTRDSRVALRERRIVLVAVLATLPAWGSQRAR